MLSIAALAGPLEDYKVAEHMDQKMQTIEAARHQAAAQPESKGHAWCTLADLYDVIVTHYGNAIRDQQFYDVSKHGFVKIPAADIPLFQGEKTAAETEYRAVARRC